MKTKPTSTSSLIPPLEFGRVNLIIFLVGLAILILGYLLMSIGPWDNPLSRTVAPLVLLIAYLVLFPIMIWYRRKSRKPEGK